MNTFKVVAVKNFIRERFELLWWPKRSGKFLIENVDRGQGRIREQIVVVHWLFFFDSLIEWHHLNRSQIFKRTYLWIGLVKNPAEKYRKKTLRLLAILGGVSYDENIRQISRVFWNNHSVSNFEVTVDKLLQKVHKLNYQTSKRLPVLIAIRLKNIVGRPMAVIKKSLRIVKLFELTLKTSK